MRPQGKPGMGPDFRGGPPQGWQPPSVSDIFERLDKNKDGKLTKDEVPAPMWERLFEGREGRRGHQGRHRSRAQEDDGRAGQ